MYISENDNDDDYGDDDINKNFRDKEDGMMIKGIMICGRLEMRIMVKDDFMVILMTLT